MTQAYATVVGAAVLSLAIGAALFIGDKLGPRTDRKREAWEYFPMLVIGSAALVSVGLLLYVAYMIGCGIVECAS